MTGPVDPVAEVRALDAAATPGPWKADGAEIISHGGWVGECLTDNLSVGDANAALIARYRTLAPQLADMVEAERARADEAQRLRAAAEDEVRRFEDFSNEVVANAGDEWDGDEAQEDIAIRYVRDLEARAARYEAALRRVIGQPGGVGAPVLQDIARAALAPPEETA